VLVLALCAADCEALMATLLLGVRGEKLCCAWDMCWASMFS